MLKGHAKIELKDINTGEIKTYEHDNMITNAVASSIGYANRFMDYSDVNKKYLPLYDKGMGGILLFQEKLDENEDNVAFPDNAANPLIGYASNDAYSDWDTMRGGKNLTESAETEDGYKYVWDFATSQANGVISALSLTHSDCGAGAYRYNSQMLWTTSSFPNMKPFSDGKPADYVDYEFDTGILTKIIYVSSTQINVLKLRIPISRIGIKTTLLVPEVISSEIINVISAGTKDKSFWVKGDDGYYLITYPSSSPYNYISIQKYNFEFSRISTSNVDLANSSISSANIKNVVVRNGYTYVMTNYYLYRINNNVGKATAIALSESTSTSANPEVLTELNGNLYSDKYVILNPEDDAKIKVIDRHKNTTNINTKTWDGTTADTLALFLSKQGCYLSFTTSTNSRIGSTNNYMASINNLTSPVTKTSAQSMKITYTITEE